MTNHNRKNGLLLLLLCITSFMWSQTKSFPEAEGYGKFSVGGRGGDIIYVTNLNDSGSGSFRAACEMSGPRIVIFRVAGIIDLNSRINISNPFITIAGQSAPGDGILLRLNSSNLSGSSILELATNHIIVRYLKIRRGPGLDGECCGDGISIGECSDCDPVHDIIIDHVSVSWTTDEAISSWYPTRDVTIQNCFVAEPLHYSTHGVGHSKGPFFANYTTNLTYYRNIVAHSADRNPWVVTRNNGFTAKFQVINNLTYNWVYFGAKIGGNGGLTKADFIGNYLKAGPDTRLNRYELLFSPNAGSHTEAYVEDNLGHHRTITGDPSTEWDIAGEDMEDPASMDYRSMTRLTTDMPIPILPVMDAYSLMLGEAGANKRINENGVWENNRDAVDTRVLAHITSEGPEQATHESEYGYMYHGLIDDPSDVGGWPVYDTTAIPYTDNDEDGMSDVWETANGLNPNDPTDGNMDADEDGYTNIEEFLNGGESALPTGTTLLDRLSVYPIPADKLVQVDGVLEELESTIYDMSGRLVFKKALINTNNTLNLENLEKGIYFLRLLDKNNNIKTSKIILK